MSRIKFTELSGKDVISQDGRELGSVSDVVLDSSSWRIEALVVKLDRDLLEAFHMKRPMFGTQTIQLPTGHVSGVGDKVILVKTLKELTALARDEVRRDAHKSAEKPAAKAAAKPEANGEGEKPSAS
ncbi:MAG TPA: PRC-barrel domain-containing protein [Sandaracinaceae bacterium]